MDTGEQSSRYQRAKERVEELKGFYVHLGVYSVVILGLFFIDFVDGGNWWFYWPLFGWGIGLAIHAFVTFGAEGPLGRGWEERKIRKLMEEDRGPGQA